MDRHHRALPELSDLILAINIDSDFESFFASLIDVLDKFFSASRISISIPNDSTDIIAVPWALKAVWNKHSLVSASHKCCENSLEASDQYSANTSIDDQDQKQFYSPFSFVRPATNTKDPNSPKILSPLTKITEDKDGSWIDDNSWDTDSDNDDVKDNGSQLLANSYSYPTEAYRLPSFSFAHGPGSTPKACDCPVSSHEYEDQPTHISFRQKFSLTRKLSRSSPNRIPSLSRQSSRSQLNVEEEPDNISPRQSKPQLTLSSTNDSHTIISDYNYVNSNVDSRPTSLYSSLQPRKNIMIFDHFNSLEYEKDPLIDAQGVVHVLESKGSVLLQRRYKSYPSDTFTANDDFPEYIDSEQGMNSPWTVSQDPSPALRALTDDYMNSSIPLKREPGQTPQDEMSAAFDNDGSDNSTSTSNLFKKYSQVFSDSQYPVHAIGCENTYSILHIALVVPSRISFGEPRATQKFMFQDKVAPLGILSIVSPIIPFPSDFKNVLESLAPHIASAFMKTSIHSSLTTQLESFMKAPNFHNPRFRQYDNSTPSLSSTCGSISGVPPSPENQFISDAQYLPRHANKSQKWQPPKKSTIRRTHRRRSRVKHILQSYGVSFLPVPEDTSNDLHSSVTSPTMGSNPAFPSNYYHWRRSKYGFERALPSSKLLRTIIDALPVQVFTLEPVTGHVTWVSNRTLAYRGLTAEEFFQNPHHSIHPDEREGYLTKWAESLRKGESLGVTIKVRRFDGRYRTTFSRAVPLRDAKGAITHWLCSMMDVHKQRQNEIEALQRARESAGDHKYKILADATPVIVFTVHPQQGVIYANNTWFNYSGCSNNATYGFEYITRIHPDDRDLFLAPQKTDPTGPSPPNIEARILGRNNKYNWHLVTYTSAEADERTGQSSLWFGTCTNINSQKLIQEKLKEAKDVAQRTIESKSRFLSNMSHEIRTPLIGISGMVSFLLDTNLSEEQLDYCHTISSSSDALLMVINDILDLSKVESGKMTLTNSWFHVRRLVEEANEFLSSMAISKSLELNYIVNSDVPVWVKGDRIRLRQVMLNIIGNAIKFTDKGEVFTRCSQLTDNNEVMLKFEVIDTGRGFTSEDEHKLFKPFSQLKYMSHQTHTPGTGLGLVISRQLLQLHGGTLKCKGEKDKGSTFVFTCKVKLPTEDDGPSQEDMNKSVNVPTNEVNSVETNNDLRILIICPYKYAAESIVHHICKTVADPAKCHCTVSSDGSILEFGQTSSSFSSLHEWTHIIINVIQVEKAVKVANRALSFIKMSKQSIEIVMLATPLQRSNILEGIEPQYRDIAKLTILYKPLKPSRYSLVFDPSKEREASQDMKMAIAQKVLENQKDIFKSFGTFTKDKQHRILLAEDNLINQKVMSKFFFKSGLQCDIAADGEDCVTKLFAKGSGYYNLILVSF